MSDLKLLYIAGYGRSGSTLLSIALDNLPGVVALGEVAKLHMYIGTDGRECSCGSDYPECPFWGEVLDRLPGGVDHIRKMGQYQSSFEPWNAMWISSDRREWHQYMKYVSRFLRTTAECAGARLLVDSSKSVHTCMWRALTLNQISDVEVYIVHLVRSAEEVVASCKKGRNIDIELGRDGRSGTSAAAVGLGGWITANLAARHARTAVSEKRSIVLKYNDFVQSPQKELLRVARMLNPYGCTLKSSNIRDSKLEVGHMVGGNRMSRVNSEVYIDPSRISKNELSLIEKVILLSFKSMIDNII
jgi:hypothetical protein